MASDGPIFIAGCGRSGTTYIKTIVDAHPRVFIPTESLFIADYLRHGRFLPAGLRKWLFFREPQLRSWYDGPAFELDDPADAVRQVHMTMAGKEGAVVWGQKTPRFVRYMLEFTTAYPDCRWILICRDPRAVVASMLKSKRHTYSLAAACRRWVRDNQPIIAHRQKPAPNVMVERFEDLVCNFDVHVERIWRFLELPPLTRQQVIAQGKVREYRGSGFSVQENNVRDGLEPQPELLDTWKRTLTIYQIRQIEQRCAEGMAALGYEPVLPGEALRPDRPMEALRQALSPAKDLMVVGEYMLHWPIYPIHTLLRKLAIHCLGRPFRSTGSVPGREGAARS